MEKGKSQTSLTETLKKNKITRNVAKIKHFTFLKVKVKEGQSSVKVIVCILLNIYLKIIARLKK